MSRLEITSPNQAQLMIEELYKDLERRIESSPPGLCPVDMTRAFVEMCHTHTCGKCVPCRVGLWQLRNLLTDVMNGEATSETLKLLDELSQSIMNGADCAIGYEAAFAVSRSLKECREDFEEHGSPGPLHLQQQHAGSMCLPVSGPCGHSGIRCPGAGGPLCRCHPPDP